MSRLSTPLGARTVRALVDVVAPRWLLFRRGSGRRRAVALTFDDGPDAMTREYLDVLDRFSARATFFVVGARCEAARSEVLEIVRRGHQVAGHGYTHRCFPVLRMEELREELRATEALLPPTPGRPIVRPPKGAVSVSSLLACARAGYTTALWSLDSDDWRNQDPADLAARLAPELLRDGEIVLLHEGQRWTVDALPIVLARLAGAGWSCVTIDELFGL